MHGNSAWSAVTELAASQHGHFTRRQAAETQLSKREIARSLHRGIIDEPHHGVLRFRGSPATWHGYLAAATLAGGGSHASHRAAARLHGLDGFQDATAIEVTVPRGRYPARLGVITHRWTGPREHDHTVVEGIPVTGVATTLAQLGAVAGVQQVEQALDDALRRGYPLDWIANTVQRLHRPGPTGTGRLLRLLSDPARRGAVPDSVFERITARLIGATDLPPPVLQHPVRLAGGGEVRIDLAWPDLNWGIECHSRQHHFGPQAEGDDNDRDHQLAMAGWHLTYVTWQQMQQPGYVVQLVRRMLATRQAS